jgi:hypothetical protein
MGSDIITFIGYLKNVVMKALKTHLKAVALFFSILIFFQGCTVYKSTSVTLNEAVKSNSIVKVTKTNGEKEKYLKIVLTDKKEFFGKNKKRIEGEYIDNYALIEPNTVSKIQIKDKTLSTVISIGIPSFIVGVFIIYGKNSAGGVPN